MSDLVAILPGSVIYGVAYSDCSAGAWNCDRDTVVETIARLREIGLTPMILVRLRMRSETLWAEVKA